MLMLRGGYTYDYRLPVNGLDAYSFEYFLNQDIGKKQINQAFSM